MRTAALFLLLLASALALLLDSVLTSALAAAPAPLPRRDRTPPAGHVRAGDYLLRWGGDEWHVALCPDGSYRGRHAGALWVGTWRYDDATRTLSVSESLGSEYHFAWSAKLDDRLAGQAGVRVELYRR